MRCAALLRGVNVGGNNMISMPDWCRSLSALGFEEVRTYIQSGNAMFSAGTGQRSVIEQRIRNDLVESFGLAVDVFVRALDDLEGLIAANPFVREAKEAPARLSVVFLHEPLSAEANRRCRGSN